MSGLAGEGVTKSSKAKVIEPVKMSGKLYLTGRRLTLVRREGTLRKKEISVFDIPLENIAFAKVEGLISKKLVIGARNPDGRVTSYKLEVGGTSSWSAAIASSRNPPPPQAISVPPPPQYQPPPPPPAYQQYQAPPPTYQQAQPQQPTLYPGRTKYCVSCGQSLPASAGFCSACGQQQ